MSGRKFSAIFSTFLISVQLFSPLYAACVHSCHQAKRKNYSHACCKSKAPSKFEIKTKSGCECSVQAGAPPAGGANFALNRSSPENSKLLGISANPSAQVVSKSLNAPLDGLPGCPLNGQNTFLLNSTLRI